MVVEIGGVPAHSETSRVSDRGTRGGRRRAGRWARSTPLPPEYREEGAAPLDNGAAEGEEGFAAVTPSVAIVEAPQTPAPTIAEAAEAPSRGADRGRARSRRQRRPQRRSRSAASSRRRLPWPRRKRLPSHPPRFITRPPSRRPRTSGPRPSSPTPIPTVPRRAAGGSAPRRRSAEIDPIARRR